MYVAAVGGFDGQVQIRSWSKDFTRLLLWTAPENLKLPSTAKAFSAATGHLAKGDVIYTELEVVRAFEKAASQDDEAAAKRLGPQLSATTIRVPEDTTVTVLRKADDPSSYYEVEARLSDGGRVRGWVTARRLHTRLEETPDDLITGLPRVPFASDADLRAGRPSTEVATSVSSDSRVRQFQKFRLGDFTYEIKQCEARERLGSQLLGFTKPGAGAVFLLVRFDIQNETKKTATVLSDDFTLRDAQGREFRPASRALSALLFEEESKDFLLTEVQPGIVKESITAFEVPKTALTGELNLIVPEKGLFGSKKIEVVIAPKTGASKAR